MKTIFLVYKTDTHHSYSSRDTIGVATDFNTAIQLCKEQAKKEHSKISKDQLFNLNNIKQTQGYFGLGEFVIEEMETNVLL